jgi:hypothetical protein
VVLAHLDLAPFPRVGFKATLRLGEQLFPVRNEHHVASGTRDYGVRYHCLACPGWGYGKRAAVFPERVKDRVTGLELIVA